MLCSVRAKEKVAVLAPLRHTLGNEGCRREIRLRQPLVEALAPYSSNFNGPVRSIKADRCPSAGTLIESTLRSTHKDGTHGQAQARMRVTDYRCQSAICLHRYSAFDLCQQLVVEPNRVAQ